MCEGDRKVSERGPSTGSLDSAREGQLILPSFASKQGPPSPHCTFLGICSNKEKLLSVGPRISFPGNVGKSEQLSRLLSYVRIVLGSSGGV